MSPADWNAKIDDSFRRVHERLDEFLRQNAEQHAAMKQQLAAIQGECKPCQALLARHEMDLRGNGDQGLRTRVALVEEEQRRLGDPSRRATLAQRTSLASVATAIATAIWTLIASMLGK